MAHPVQAIYSIRYHRSTDGRGHTL